VFSVVERFAEDAFGKQENGLGAVRHLKRTAFWAEKLSPGCDEAILIAAVSHDIERAFVETSVSYQGLKDGFMNPEYLTRHQQRSAKVISDFLRARGAAPDLVKRVKELVLRHEEGGDAASNLVMNADSLSFLENSVARFIAAEVPLVGRELVKRKFDWMYQRISSSVAREIAQDRYARALRLLDEAAEK
jgi:hypothetical protein